MAHVGIANTKIEELEKHLIHVAHRTAKQPPDPLQWAMELKEPRQDTYLYNTHDIAKVATLVEISYNMLGLVWEARYWRIALRVYKSESYDECKQWLIAMIATGA